MDRARRRPRMRVVRDAVVCVVLVGAAALAAVLARGTGPAALPSTIAGPTIPGEVVAAWSSVRGTVSLRPGPGYQPSGFSVVRPAGRTMHVAIRCAGRGRVEIDAGRRFVFDCSGPDAVLVQDDPVPRTDRFIITAGSRGSLIWSGTVTTRPVR